MFCGSLILAAHKTRDGGGVAVDELAQHMDAQIAGGTGQEDIAQLLSFTLEERLHRIALQDGINAGVVEVIDFMVGRFDGCLTAHKLCQQTWRRIGEHISVGHVVASLVGLDDDLGHHQ